MKYSTWTVVKLKNRKGQPWQGILKYKTEEGKWRNKSRVWPEAKGKKEAERLTEAWFDELNAESAKNEENTYTLHDTIANFIEHQYERNELEKSSYRLDKEILTKYIDPFIGNLIFKEIDRHDLEKWITQLHQKGWKQSTIHNAYKVVRKTYNYYYKMGDITWNPCNIKVPKGEPRQSHMTSDQANALVRAINAAYRPEEKMYVGIYLGYYAALRTSEICGLRWRDIDLDANTLSITSAVGRGERENYMKGPKSKSSYRTIPLLPQLREILQYHFNLYSPSPSWFVCGEKEEFMSPALFSTNFKNFRDEYELLDAFGKKLSPHSLRHHFGYTGAKTVDISSLSSIMGHASRALTLDTYGSTDANAVKLATEMLGEEYKKTD